MKKLFVLFGLIGAGLFYTSCVQEQKENNKSEVEVADNEIALKIGGDAVTTKGASPKTNVIATFDLTEPGDEVGLVLTASVSSLDDAYFAEQSLEPGTKGAPVYTETFSAAKLSTIPFYYADGGTPAENKSNCWSEVQDQASNYYRFNLGENADKNALLFLSMPLDMSNTASQHGVSNLTRSAVSASGIAYNGVIKFDYETPAAAANQKDLLFTSKSIKAGTKGRVPVLFYHTMAGVKFKSDNAKRETKNGQIITTIDSIKITNIKYKGSCTVTPMFDIDNSKHSADCSIWTVGDDKKQFSINNLGITSNNGQYAASTGFEGQNPADSLGQYNINDSAFENTFMFIPQETGDDVELTIVYHLGNNTSKKYSRKVSFKGQNWEAGKLYTYTLAANHVAVSVVDDLDTDQKIKQNLAITNTGNVDSYIRAAIVANWFDTHDASQVVCPWKNTPSEGTFSGLNLEDWAYSDPANGGDGFYYYKYKVRPGEETHDLFTTYTVGECYMPLYKATAHLEMEVLAQAIDAAKLAKMKDSYGWKTDFFTDGYTPSN